MSEKQHMKKLAGILNEADMKIHVDGKEVTKYLRSELTGALEDIMDDGELENMIEINKDTDPESSDDAFEDILEIQAEIVGILDKHIDAALKEIIRYAKKLK